MVSVDYDSRLLCDSNFINWLSTHPNKTKISSWLMHIKSSSLHYRGCHNLILDFEALKCINEAKDGVSKMFKITPSPRFIENYVTSDSKNITYAIFLTHHKPYKSYIFTNKERKNSYEEDPHYKDKVKSVVIKDGEDAIKIIKILFEEFCRERERIRAGLI